VFPRHVLDDVLIHEYTVCHFSEGVELHVDFTLAGGSHLVMVYFHLYPVLFFDRIRIDDPVGAISAHLTCGILGTLAVGLFAQDQFAPGTTGNGLFFGGGPKLLFAQLVGVVAVGAFIFSASFLGWSLIKATIGIRVTPEEELAGLDIGEHGIVAYPEFQTPSEGLPGTGRT